mmetsp:Transcript_20778/g.67267  ORF Transcript_20778/g.67267 Transcript_20778/m.67267 type:complete len:222 (+) Transcript_20778:557-1222(+)
MASTDERKVSGSRACRSFSAATRKKQAPTPELRASASPKAVTACPVPLSDGGSRKHKSAPKQPIITAPMVVLDTAGPLKTNQVATSPSTSHSDDIDSKVAACAMDVRISEDWKAPRLMLSASPAPTSSVTSPRVRRSRPSMDRPRVWYSWMPMRVSVEQKPRQAPRSMSPGGGEWKVVLVWTSASEPEMEEHTRAVASRTQPIIGTACSTAMAYTGAAAAA